MNFISEELLTWEIVANYVCNWHEDIRSGNLSPEHCMASSLISVCLFTILTVNSRSMLPSGASWNLLCWLMWKIAINLIVCEIFWLSQSVDSHTQLEDQTLQLDSLFLVWGCTFDKDKRFIVNRNVAGRYALNCNVDVC